MTLVRDEAGAGMHALIVGVGAYPHLLGGSKADAKDKFGLVQLTSPPVSARAFADWLLTRFQNPEVPLKSLDLLVSEGDEESGYTTPDGRDLNIGIPIKAALGVAIEEWCNRADGAPENIALLFFCGHGLAKGCETALLAADFGDPGKRTMANAIHFDALTHTGMEGCQARRQCYFIDACRNEPAKLLRIDDLGDDKLLEPWITTVHEDARDWPVFYATARDDRAHALAGQQSRFTTALVAALEGAGSDDQGGGPWVVDTYSLAKGINAVLELGNRGPDVPRQRGRSGGEDAGFVLHHLAEPPRVPVVVECKPRGAGATARLAISGPGPALELGPTGSGWQFDLAAVEEAYRLELRFAGGEYRNAVDILKVRPAYREKVIEVSA